MTTLLTTRPPSPIVVIVVALYVMLMIALTVMETKTQLDSLTTYQLSMNVSLSTWQQIGL